MINTNNVNELIDSAFTAIWTALSVEKDARIRDNLLDAAHHLSIAMYGEQEDDYNESEYLDQLDNFNYVGSRHHY